MLMRYGGAEQGGVVRVVGGMTCGFARGGVWREGGMWLVVREEDDDGEEGRASKPDVVVVGGGGEGAAGGRWVLTPVVVWGEEEEGAEGAEGQRGWGRVVGACLRPEEVCPAVSLLFCLFPCLPSCFLVRRLASPADNSLVLSFNLSLHRLSQPRGVCIA